MKKNDIKYTIGIDEAGRGPVAGPVSVGAVLIPEKFMSGAQEIFGEVKDSKKLSAKKREEWFAKMQDEKKVGNIDFVVAFATAHDIDTIGIVPSIRRALSGAINKLTKSASRSSLEAGSTLASRLDLEAGVEAGEIKILLDGGLSAPEEFVNQETIIKGDEKEMIISMASIVAKVVRDKEMLKLSKKYPEYELEKHKGYGTKVHYKKIKEFGISKIHRVTFLKNL